MPDPTIHDLYVALGGTKTDPTILDMYEALVVLGDAADPATAITAHENAANPHPTYETSAEAQAKVDAAVAALVNSSPSTLNTLKELSDALGADPNFATTMATALGNKQASAANLTVFAALSLVADRLPYANGTGTLALATLTSFARSILDDVDAAAVRATLGLGTAATAASGDFAAASHGHAGSDVTSGTVAIARLPASLQAIPHGSGAPSGAPSGVGLYFDDVAAKGYGYVNGAWVPFSSAGGSLVGERSLWDTPASYPLSADGSEMEYADRTAFLVDFARRNVADAHLAFPPGSHVEVRFDAEGDELYRSLAAPSTANFWALMEWSEGRHLDSMVGLGIWSTAGAGIGLCMYQGTLYHVNLSSHAYLSFGNAVTSSTIDDAIKSGKRVLFGIERIGTTSYRGAVSIDGATLETRPTANTPTAFTPAYYGPIRMFSGGSTTESWRRIHRLWTAPTFP